MKKPTRRKVTSKKNGRAETPANKDAGEANPQHKRGFEQLLDDAIFGIQGKKK